MRSPDGVPGWGGMMRRSIRRATILAGLTMFVTGVAGGREGRAALSINIKGSGGTVSGTDPIDFYTIDVTLKDSQWNQHDYLRIDGLDELTGDSISPGYVFKPQSGSA